MKEITRSCSSRDNDSKESKNLAHFVESESIDERGKWVAVELLDQFIPLCTNEVILHSC